MKAEDIIKIIDYLPQYIQYIYPGYITIYLYLFFRGKSIKDTKAIILKSIGISYICVLLAESLVKPLFNSLLLYFFNNKNISINGGLPTNICLVFIALLCAYIPYRVVKYEKTEICLKKLKITTTFSDDEIALFEKEAGIWASVYLKDKNLMYEGSLVYKQMDPEHKCFICLSGYTEYLLDDKYEKTKLTSNRNNNNEYIIIYFNEIERIKFRDMSN